jgi:threonyl-tRNA synthetase
LRVRGFTQDDAHIFCTQEQLADEIDGVLDLVHYLMTTFGYTYSAYLATRPEKSLGTESEWTFSTNAARQALERREMDYTLDEGGGAFYGPKIDIKLYDALGREWQGPTIQIDLNLPERFDVTYVGPDGRDHRVIMVHRAVLGSMERFIGGLVEHYAGSFPPWLAPVQARVLSISEDQAEATEAYARHLRDAGIRAEPDARGEKISYKVRQAEVQKVPYILILGGREVDQGTVSLRLHSRGDLGALDRDEVEQMILEDIRAKALVPGAKATASHAKGGEAG